MEQELVAAVKPVYTNRRGKDIEVKLTVHAKYRFWQRWNLIFQDQPLDKPNAERTLVEWFNKSRRLDTRVERRIYQNRMKRYGQDSLYFINYPFIFSVQAQTLITVELDKNRELNRLHGLPKDVYRRIKHPELTPSAPKPSGVTL